MQLATQARAKSQTAPAGAARARQPAAERGFPIGNQAVLRRKCAACGEAEERSGVQPSLRIGPVDDPLEREADRAADRVMRMTGEPPRPTASPLGIRRACAECEREETIRRDGATEPGDRADADRAADAVARGGALLPGALRAFFEPRFGQDFSSVRLHTGPATADAAAAIDARAYALGSGIGFASGAYQPASEAGRRLIAHELAHVVQQGGGVRLVQRQEEEDVPGQPGGGPRGIPTPNLDIDPTALSEPPCPSLPTNLGNLAPVSPCPEDGDEFDGFIFRFCADSDVFSERKDFDTLRQLVSTSASGSTFRIRAYSSVEGPGSAENAALYNRNLSCHRLNRMIRELLNLGVQERQIDAVSMGPTERFGKGTEFLALNRVAVLAIDSATPPARPDATGMSMAQIRDAAKQDIANGDYPIQADAYMARWTCGRWRTLSEAVGRTTVLIEGAETKLGAGKLLGAPAATGENTIVLSPDIVNATDPIGCAANRITDLTFHHFSRPVLPSFDDQHRAGMHLVFLANYPACSIQHDPLGGQVDVIAPPAPVDPFIGFMPHCADRPLAGPLGAQKGPATMETPPTFTLRSLTLAGTSGGVGASPSGNPFTVGVEPDQPFEVHAEVDAAGTPASVGNYEIGFVQTVMAESWINTHVDGRRERRRFPLPLRDGPPRDAPVSDPPWFDSNSATFAAPGTNQVMMSDAPNFRAFRFLPNLASSVFVQSVRVAQPGGGPPVTLERPTFDPRLGPPLPANASQQDVERERQRIAPLLNNVPDRGRRVLDFNTWVVARRANPPAADTLEETQFIAGLRLTFRLDANWTSTASGAISGAGSYSLTSRAATDADTAEVRLRGATPLDFTGPGGVPLFAEFLDIDPPLPRARAGGLPRSAYADAVRQIALPHRTTPTLRNEVSLRIRIDVTTGRVILDTPDLQHGAIRVVSGADVIDTPEMRTFTRAIFPEIRRLVAGPGFASNEPPTGVISISVTLPPLGAP